MSAKVENYVVVVGIDGSMHSFVAAYLMKKQGFNCIAVTVVVHDRDEDLKDLIGPWLPGDLEQIKNVCDSLEIPFYATNASERYFEEVVEKIVSARLMGVLYCPLADRNKVIIETLIEKGKKFKANKIVTGHFAKIVHNKKTDHSGLFVANDEKNDETYSLANISVEDLNQLHFPLADLRLQEVEKIFNLLDTGELVDNYLEKRDGREAFYRSDLTAIIEKYAAKSLVKDGLIYGQIEETTHGEHDGISSYYLGQGQLQFKAGVLDKEYVICKITPSKGSILIEKERKLYYEYVLLERFQSGGDLDCSLPIKCFLRFRPRGELVACTAYFKNNNGVEIHFNERQIGCCPDGLGVVLYSKKGSGARVLGMGKIFKSGFYINSKFRTVPPNKVEAESLEEAKKIETFRELRF